MRPGFRRSCLAVVACLVAGAEAQAANAAFQDFFFAVCGAPGGTLAARCAETPGGLGNLSGDSESSLNPSHNLSHNRAPVAAAQSRVGEARERAEKLRDGEPADAGAPRVDVGPFSLLVNLRGSWFDRDRDAQVDAERGFDGDTYAAEIGLDYRASDRVVLGGLVGIERTDYEFDAEAPGVNFTPAAQAGDADGDHFFVIGFASWSVAGSGFIEVAAGHQRGNTSYRRNSVFQESTRTLPQVEVRVRGKADNRLTWLSANGGFDIERGAWTFGPYAGLTATWSKVEGYTEEDLSQSGLAMSFDRVKRNSLLGHAGLRASVAASTSTGVFLPQLRVEYQHEFDDDRESLTSRFALDPAANEYLQAGDAQDRDSFNVGLGLAVILPNGWMPFVDVSRQFGGGGFDRTRATLGLRVEF